MTSLFRFIARMQVALLFVALAAVAGSGRGQTPLPGLPAVVNVGASGLDAARVKAAVEQELGVSLRLDPDSAERLEIVLTGRRANVTYFATGKQPVTRSVDLPNDAGQATATIAFLVGNLARDEAQALLDELRARELPPPPPAPPPPEPPPPEPEAAQPAEAPKPEAPAPPAEPAREAAKEPELAKTPINLSFYYPITLHANTEQRRVNVELGLAYSKLGAVRGVGLSLGHLRVNHLVQGMTWALIWNRAGRVRGAQLGAVYNEGFGTLEGVSSSAVVSYRDGDVRGAQLAGIFSGAERGQGLQASGIAGVATATDGFQLAGIFARSGERVQGAQLAGITSMTRSLTGAQVSGVVNVAEDVTGLQLSVVNIGKRVRGAQLGVLNVSDQIDGGALGLVSIAGNGRIQPIAWMSSGTNTALNAGVKFLTGYTYSYVGGGHDLAEPRFRLEAGAGGHLTLAGPVFLEFGLAYAGEWKDDQDAARNGPLRQELRYDLRVGVEAGRAVTLFAGGGFSQRLTGEGRDLRGQFSFGAALF